MGSLTLLSRPQRLDRDWQAFIRSSSQNEPQGKPMKVWNLLKTTYKVSDFIGWQRDDSLTLNPDFQRRSVWKAGAKSYLIDTIIRGLPIPIIFLRDRRVDLSTYSPMRDVVDGQQRLRTVIAFLAPMLLKKDFDQSRDVFVIDPIHSEEYGGRAFADLPDKVKKGILDYQFTVNVFPLDTDDREIKQVFARMNSTGYRLNGQELRNAEYFGAFKTRAYELATEQLNRWREWRVFSADDLSRMLEVELTSELMILMLKGVSEKSDKVIGSYYKKYDKTFEEGAEIARRHRCLFETIQDELLDAVSCFRKRTLFYAMLATVYDLQYGIGTGVSEKKKKPRDLSKSAVARIKQAGERIREKSAPQRILDAKTRRTTHIKERKELIHYLLTLR